MLRLRCFPLRASKNVQTKKTFFRWRCNHTFAETLNLPKTSFPMRADAGVREPEMQQHCGESLYNWQKIVRSEAPQYILHDGPPFANGKLHIGHLLNKVLKDIINRYKLLQGFGIQFYPGWDCHGLPIEIKALDLLPSKQRNQLSPIEVRQQAEKLARSAAADQMKDFKRWGILGDWNRAYYTMDPEYEGEQLDVFSRMVSQGLLYRATKPVHWSPSSHTALAEAELEYNDAHISQSVYVAFDIHSAGTTSLASALDQFPNLQAVIWTTTPWTLPSNVALCVHPTLVYVVLRVPGTDTTFKHFLVAESMAVSLLALLKLPPLVETDKSSSTTSSVLLRIPGEQLAGVEFRHPFRAGQFSRVICGRHVSAESGTGVLADECQSLTKGGVVHTAPGHGLEDYQAVKQANSTLAAGVLPLLSPMWVDEAGRFTEEAGAELMGKAVLTEGTAAVLDLLVASRGALLWSGTIQHRYPYDWRTKKPIIQRAALQWFCRLDRLKQGAVDALTAEVVTIPASGRRQLQNVVAAREEWCISRQRHWGLPIPVFYDTETDKPLMTTESIAHVRKLISEQGSSCWWSLPIEQLLPPSHRNNGRSYRRGTDTMDVWFDSGVAWIAALKPRGINLHSFNRSDINHSIHPHKTLGPVDLVLEGEDQYRGWFQSLLLTSVALTGHAPYKTIITHGFVLDEQGRKMSKSIGNVVDPNIAILGGKLISIKLSVTVLMCGCNNRVLGVGCPPEPEKRTCLRCGCSTSLGIFNRLHLGRVDWTSRDWYTRAMGGCDLCNQKMFDTRNKIRNTLRFLLSVLYDFGEQDYVPYQQLLPVSALYASVVKDRLYSEGATSKKRRAAQTVIYEILQTCVRLWAPILCHTSEEIYQHFPPLLKQLFRSRCSRLVPEIPALTNISNDSVFQHGFVASNTVWRLSADEQHRWSVVMEIRELVNRQLEASRTNKLIGSSFEAAVTLWIPASLWSVLQVVAPVEPVQNSGEPDDVTTDHTARGALIAALEELFIVSKIILIDAPKVEDTDAAEKNAVFWCSLSSFPGGDTARVGIQIMRAAPEKCARCWRRAEPGTDSISAVVPSNNVSPACVCARCQTVLRKLVPVSDLTRPSRLL